MKRTYIAQSTKSNPREAVLELKKKFDSEISSNSNSSNSKSKNNIKAITFFASFIYEPAELINTMNEVFPNILVFGCSSAGEIISGKMNLDSIVAMAFTDEVIEDIKVEVITDLDNIDLQPVIQSFEEHYSTPLYQLDNKKYFGLIYTDGLDGRSKNEENILDELGNHTSVIFTGGSARDDDRIEDYTTIYANNKYYHRSAVLALIKSKVNFAFDVLQNFEPTGHTVIATKVDEENRIIYELDNKPAAEVLAGIINTSIPEISNYFLKYSFALVIDNQPYIRIISGIIDNTALQLGCSIKNETGLTVMKSGNLIENTKKSLDEIKKKHKTISGILLFNCILRYFEAQIENTIDEYATLFSDVPTVGFITYGEAFIGHLNHTATMLILE
jgi:hypothetical protein